MKRKVLISVAPVAATDTHIDPEKIAKDVINCAKAGAAMVHLHVRDENGKLTNDLSLLRETLELIRKESDIVIEVSTGGVSDLTIEERCAPLYDNLVEACSLNVGSTNLGDSVYKNSLPDVRYCIKEIKQQSKIPEVEVFEIGHINTMVEMGKEFDIKDPLYTIVLGHPGEAPATPEALIAMYQYLPSDARWGITHAYRKDYSIISAALGLGAQTVRIGFEDSKYINENDMVETNLPLVEKTVNLLKAMDLEPMNPEEAREFLAMKKEV